MKTQSVSIIIPIYNERENIQLLLLEIEKVRGQIQSSEIIFIDDGSIDGSQEVLKDITKNNPHVKVVLFSRNYGQTPAMGAGIKYATGEIIIPLDGDLQNDPADIPRLLAKIEEGYDIVSGWRKDRKDKFLRTALSKLANRLIVTTTGVKLNDYGCTLKAYRASIVKNIDFFGEIHRLIPVYASWQGAKVTEIVVTHHERKFGSSKYGFSRIGKLLLDLMVVKYFLSFSKKPIYFFGWLGFLSFFLGILSFLFALYLRFFEDITLIQTPLPIFTALLCLVGIQLLSVGLIADMIVRLRPENERAVYTVKESIGFE